MSEFKNISNEEKITHYLAGELSNDEKAEFELELKKNSRLAEELKAYQSLISLMNVDKKTLSIEGGIGAERKNKIFGKQDLLDSNKSDSRILNIFKHMRFTIVAAALVLLSYFFLPELWNQSSSTKTQPNTRVPEVAGVRSFNIALPSGTYYLTSKDGLLNIDDVVPTEGNDYLKKAGVQKGDQILKINGVETGTIKSDDLSNLLTSLLEKPTVYLEIKRNGQILPTNKPQPK